MSSWPNESVALGEFTYCSLSLVSARGALKTQEIQ